MPCESGVVGANTFLFAFVGVVVGRGVVEALALVGNWNCVSIWLTGFAVGSGPPSCVSNWLVGVCPPKSAEMLLFVGPYMLLYWELCADEQVFDMPSFPNTVRKKVVRAGATTCREPLEGIEEPFTQFWGKGVPAGTGTTTIGFVWVIQ